MLLHSLLNLPTLILKRDPSNIWINPFAKSMTNIWQANINAQYILDAFATMKYVSSYITKIDWTMTISLNKNKEQCHVDNDGKIETMRKHGSVLLNMQQISTRKESYIVLSFPLYSSSRKIFLINTAWDVRQTIVFKKPSLLQKEPDDLEDIFFLYFGKIHHTPYWSWKYFIGSICILLFLYSYNHSEKK